MKSYPWTPSVPSFEPSLSTLPYTTTSRGRVAQTLCERFGLQPLPTGSIAPGPRLIILDRFDYLAIVGILAILPRAEVVALTLPRDMDSRLADPLEVWHCAGSQGNFLAVVKMRLAAGKHVIIGPQQLPAIADYCSVDRAVLVTTNLEPSPYARASGPSYHLHILLGDGSRGGQGTGRDYQSQEADRLNARPLR